MISKEEYLHEQEKEVMRNKYKKISGIFLLMLVMLSSIMVMDENVEAKTVKKRGIYHTAAIKNYSKSDYYFMPKTSPVLKKIKITKNKITTYGSFQFRKSEKDYTNNKYIGKSKRTFKVSKKCTYWDGAWTPGGEYRVSKKVFYANLKSLVKRNIPVADFEMQVKNGKVVKMMMGQG